MGCRGRHRPRRVKKLFGEYQSFQAWRFTFHTITNPLIEVDGDTATGECSRLEISFNTDMLVSRDSIYADQLVSAADDWKFRELKVTSRPGARVPNSFVLHSIFRQSCCLALRCNAGPFSITSPSLPSLAGHALA